MRYNLIAIEGNIGSGKTSLATNLAESTKAKLVLEQFADNPFLPRFYADQDANAFPLELFFMAERFQQLKNEVTNLDVFSRLIVSDYMFTKSLIFAKVTLGEDEFRLYQRLFGIINPNLPVPDLIVYLNASIPQLLNNIAERGRAYEQDIQAAYLQKLHDTYMDYFKQQPNLRILILNMTDSDYYRNPEKTDEVFEIIDNNYPIGITRLDI